MILTPNMDTSICVLSIDPGITNTGVAVGYMDLKIPGYTRLETVNLTLSELAVSDRGLLDRNYGSRFTRLIAFKRVLGGMMNTHNPAVVVVESAFFMPGRPMVYGSLTEVIYAVKEVCYEYNKYLNVRTYTPTEVKRKLMASIGVKTRLAKEDITHALGQIPTLTQWVDLSKCTEHEQDAIAINYCFYLDLRF